MPPRRRDGKQPAVPPHQPSPAEPHTARSSGVAGGRPQGPVAAAAAPVAPPTDEMQKLTVQPPAPSSSKALRFPDRPDFGRFGKRIQVRANHFLVDVADRNLHHYDVSIS